MATGTSKGTGIGWFGGLEAKILLTLLLVTTAVLGGFAVFELNRAHDRLSSELERRADTAAERLARHLEGPVWALNDEQVADSIEAAMLDRNLVAVIVRGEDGQSIYVGRGRGADGAPQPLNEAPSGEHVSSTVQLLHNNEEAIGSLEVYMSRRWLDRQFSEQVGAELQRVVILDIVLIVVTLVLLRRVVVAPIQRITQASEQIAAGQLDTNLEIETSDEIGTLSAAIGKLQTSLRIAMRRMKQGGGSDDASSGES